MTLAPAIDARLSAEVMMAAASLPFAIAVLVIAIAIVRVVPSGRAAPAELAGGLALALEFLLAAGLLRLAAVDELRMLGVVALIVVVRQTISAGVRQSVRGLRGSVPRVRA